jgi:hypothetical protein
MPDPRKPTSLLSWRLLVRGVAVGLAGVLVVALVAGPDTVRCPWCGGPSEHWCEPVVRKTGFGPRVSLVYFPTCGRGSIQRSD